MTAEDFYNNTRVTGTGCWEWLRSENSRDMVAKGRHRSHGKNSPFALDAK
jgi:hypothetical protein